ncbi:glycosyltransferase family 39 protein [Candidatus Saccharibacteria bacterium]|nr:glycosyltransferase family 39 protein [Candidatus Saccharibacteria bacterium]
MKFKVVDYVANNMQLPHGADEAVRDAKYGSSYAFKPFVSYIFSGVLVHYARMFTQSFRIIVFAARLTSVAFIVGYAIMVILISKKLFKGVWRALFAMIAVLIPQVLYIGGYLNNDSMALFAVAFIVYAWLVGLETKWSIKSCILLGIGVGICALSYYNAFGYILCSLVIFIITACQQRTKLLKILGKGLIIFAIAFGLSGWHYIRNAILYNGDAFDFHTSKDYAEEYALPDYKPSGLTRRTGAGRGIDFLDLDKKTDWYSTTLSSFFGRFGYMTTPINTMDYTVYKSIFTIGLVGTLTYLIYLIYYYVKKRRRMSRAKLKIPPTKITFAVIMGVSIIIPIVLSLLYSWNNDFQPQGRYLMSALIPLAYFVVMGYRFLLDKINIAKRNIFLGIIFVFLVIAPISAFFLRVFPEFPW